MKLGTFQKQPQERLSKSILYTESLDPGDSISTINACYAEPEDLDVSPVLIDGERIRIWVSGGVNEEQYKITVNVTTAGGEIFEDELFCRVREI